MKQKLDIIKIGGDLLDKPETLSSVLKMFSENKNLKILVHGGGKSATKWSEKLGLKPKLIDGKRITNAENLEIVVMIYAGLINKSVVAQLQSLQCNAVGLSGADLNSIRANKKSYSDIDFGFVGEIESIHIANLNVLLLSNFCPVFSAITHDGKGQLLNTNADSIAAQLAIAFSFTYEVRLLFCFEKSGVLFNSQDENSVIPILQKQNYLALKEQGIIKDGMLPKLENGFLALQNGVREVCIGKPEIINGNTNLFSKLSL